LLNVLVLLNSTGIVFVNIFYLDFALVTIIVADELHPAGESSAVLKNVKTVIIVVIVFAVAGVVVLVVVVVIVVVVVVVVVMFIVFVCMVVVIVLSL